VADATKIEWTDSTFNPWIGCTRVSPGCDHCYAAVSTPARSRGIQWGAGQPRVRTKTWGDPDLWNKTPFFECPDCGLRGDARAMGDRPSPAPLPGDAADFIARQSPPRCKHLNAKTVRRRVFCASLADVFDNEVPIEWRADLLMLIRATPNLDWLLLTKRIGTVPRLLAQAADLLRVSGRLDGWDWLNDWICGSPPANVKLGASIVNQEEADRDIPKLLATPARVRFLSMEPLLGPVDLRCLQLPSDPGTLRYMDAMDRDAGARGVDWVIVGGESGHGARPMHPDWARSLRDQCAATGVPFLFKQWGEWVSVSEVAGPGAHHAFPDGATVRRTGKKLAGRRLDGVMHDGFPEVNHG
jgi:protein gp37